MFNSKLKNKQSETRAKRTRAKLANHQENPRLSVSKSLRHIYAQIIDDKTGRVLAHASDMKSTIVNKTQRADEVGALIATLATKAKVSQVRFDRGPHKYHGRIAALAESARKNGLKF